MSKIHDLPGHLTRRLHQKSVAAFSAHMTKFNSDITPVQFSALAELLETGSQDQASLAMQIGYDRATVGGVIDRLEAKGLVKRAPKPNDRRAWLVELTPQGRTLIKAALPDIITLQGEILAPLTDDEIAQLTKLLRKAVGV